MVSLLHTYIHIHAGEIRPFPSLKTDLRFAALKFAVGIERRLASPFHRTFRKMFKNTKNIIGP